MKAARLSQFTTDDGDGIVLKEEVYATISDANRQEAYAWLVEHGLGDIIKSKLEFNFGKGEQDTLTEFLERIDEQGMQNYKLKEDIHPQTLKALVREWIASGEEFPQELFGVYQYKEAVLK